MRKKPKPAKTVLNLRDMPVELMAKVKGAAAFERTSLKSYITALLASHIDELEKKGILPKGGQR